MSASTGRIYASCQPEMEHQCSRMAYTEPAFTASLLFCDVSRRTTTALDRTQACRDLEKNLLGGHRLCILHAVCQKLDIGNGIFLSTSVALCGLWAAKSSTACSCAARVQWDVRIPVHVWMPAKCHCARQQQSQLQLWTLQAGGWSRVIIVLTEGSQKALAGV